MSSEDQHLSENSQEASVKGKVAVERDTPSHYGAVHSSQQDSGLADQHSLSASETSPSLSKENSEQGARHDSPVKPRRRVRQEQDNASFDSTEREMTLKDIQEAMNKRHPFGLPIWKPALYKKSRSVVRKANSSLHASPSSSPELFLYPGNIAWMLLFGWWLALVMLAISCVLLFIPWNGPTYALVLRELALYLLWPFGRYVERHMEITPSDPRRSFSSDRSSDEESGLLGDTHQDTKAKTHRNYQQFLVACIKLGPAGWVYYALFFGIAAPLLLLVSTVCWLCVVTIPMAKLNYKLVRHLFRHPLTLRFKSSPSGQSHMNATGKPIVILLCTYQAFGLQYYKYTYDGINIMFINLLPIVFFVLLDDYVLKKHWPDALITSPAVVFSLSLASVIPLSYFIGMGVSSVSAQSSMGVGAVINATFGSIIEIILYAVSLAGGKSSLVEGSLIGSFLAGVLLLPGCSMISSGAKRKEQRFNAKSAGVTSTMLIMAIIGVLTPTLFYQISGSFELRCTGCPESNNGTGIIACTQCHYDQVKPSLDPVYQNSVKPLMWICAAILPSVYIIGLVFSLHTHVDMVWKSPTPKAQPKAHVPSYQKLLPIHILPNNNHHHQKEAVPYETSEHQPRVNGSTVGPSSAFYSSNTLPHRTDTLVSTNYPLYGSNAIGSIPSQEPLYAPIDTTLVPVGRPASLPTPSVGFIHAKEPEEEEEEEEAAGHDSPNWSKAKSFTVLFACTLLYSLIAEVLVDTVDSVMESMVVDEKFLGLTLFALVPNITEFMNAISFALNGNIVLSMEIGSAYALQVCLLQIPAMVAFSLWYNWGKEELTHYTFNLVFPRWDVISVVFSVFLLTYTYQEGKANYFKGSILILSYCVLMAGFYYIPPTEGYNLLSTAASTANLV
ncbi:Sodium/calcium exchanger protein-domain-containing protein [Spinellus fusiger]|nr:Sodium/calcium exchanger protein-domain-containing protein [Spinellus fusiger]